MLILQAWAPEFRHSTQHRIWTEQFESVIQAWVAGPLELTGQPVYQNQWAPGWAEDQVSDKHTNKQGTHRLRVTANISFGHPCVLTHTWNTGTYTDSTSIQTVCPSLYICVYMAQKCLWTKHETKLTGSSISWGKKKSETAKLMRPKKSWVLTETPNTTCPWKVTSAPLIINPFSLEWIKTSQCSQTSTENKIDCCNILTTNFKERDTRIKGSWLIKY